MEQFEVRERSEASISRGEVEDFEDQKEEILVRVDEEMLSEQDR